MLYVRKITDAMTVGGLRAVTEDIPDSWLIIVSRDGGYTADAVESSDIAKVTYGDQEDRCCLMLMTPLREPVKQDKTSYHGFSNWETWSLNLWICNDEYLYEQMQEVLKRCDTVSEFAKSLEEFITETGSYEHNGLPHFSLGDLRGFRELEKVDWDQLARNLWRDYYEH